MATIQKEPQRGNETYPKGEDEIKKARANLVKSIHLQSIQQRILQLLQGPPEQAMQAIAQLIAQVVSKLIASIKGKFGAKVHIKLVMMLIKLAVEEIELISKGSGRGPMPPQVKAQIAQLAGNMMDQIRQQQQGQQQRPPQGHPPMQQGPPQAAPPQQEVPTGPGEAQGLLG